MQIGEKIKKIRKFRDMSQQQIAEKLNMTSQAYGQLEQGKTAITTDRLQKIAEVLEITVEDLENMDDKAFIINAKAAQEGHHKNARFVINLFGNTEETSLKENQTFVLLEKIISDKDKQIEQLQKQIDMLFKMLNKE